MNKKLLTLSLAAILAAPAAFADTEEDGQTVTVTVPEINLIDVATDTVAIPALELIVAGEAGSGFGNKTTTTTYAFSGNTASDGTMTNQIEVEASDIPEGGTLKITSAALGGGTAGTASTTGLTRSTLTGTLLTAIGNVAAPSTEITYTFGPTTAGGMVGYTNPAGNDVTLTYTISNG